MSDETNGIISLGEFRNKKQEEKKRKTERIFFDSLMSVYAVVTPGRMAKVDVIDVSETGLAIQIPYRSERKWPTQDKDIELRLYFSPDSFMSLKVDIKNSRPMIENGARYFRYGCEVQVEQKGFSTWAQFVSFLRNYSDVSEKDAGNIGVGNL